MYPMVPGHEFVGKVIAVGPDVTRFKVGDIAGIGAVTDGCLGCESCANGDEQYCQKGGWHQTYNQKKIYGHYGGNQDIPAYGGYTSSFCHHERFVTKLPDGIDQAKAAPLLCAGVTLYDPMKFMGATKKDKKMSIGVIGIGGLGTMGIKLIKALGHEAVAITSSPNKVEMAKQKGADKVVVSTSEESMKEGAGSCHFILNTVSAPHEAAHYLGLLKSDGNLIQLGVFIEPHTVCQVPLILGRKAISGSLIGGVPNTEECIQFCFDNNVYPDIEVIKANQITWAWEQLNPGKGNPDGVRYVIDISASKEDKAFMP
jgi:uncharacterized zinc-type alcohol dehydrogenase-like protein